MKKFIFDVDGTLTDSRQKMNDVFCNFFKDFCVSNEVYIVTGSDRPKTVEQLGQDLLDLVNCSYNCAGNETWKKSTLVSKEEWTPSSDLICYLETLLERSKFQVKTGKHIEIRNGMVNFSILGRNCDKDQRKEYVNWDLSTSERHHLVEKISRSFPDVDVYIGGETGLDIFKKGGGKASAIPKIRIDSEDILYYFGDQIFPSGNDYEAAMMCDHRYNVRNWGETFEILSYFCEARICA
jgi:phosphomannomutase